MENPKSSRVFTEGSSLPRESLLQSARYSTLSRDQFPVDEKAPKNKTPHHHFHSTSNTPQHPVSSSLTSFTTKTPQGSTSPSLNLNYSKKELVKLPKVMLDYAASLQTLDLSKNLFKEFPEEILKLTRLKTLKFEANYLKRIPAEISQLTQLENMSFASNYIVVVPKTIGKLAKTLQSLNLSYNHIGQFPKEITELSNLKVLHIQNNFFTSLPVQLNSLTSLKEIGLEWFKYTNPSLSAIQNDKSNFAIIKLFELCNKIDEQNKTEFDFEDFINHFSLLGGNIFSMRDTLKRNLLHITAIEQEIGIVRYLAEHKESFLDEMDQDGQTPLSLAVREEKYFVARLLLSHGADPKIGGGPFGSALHMVTSKQHVVMIKELLKHGASPNITDAEGNTPLHLLFSVFSKSVETSKEIAKLLMDAGADLNQMNNDLWTPLHMAIRRGQLECVQWTVESNTRNKGKENKIFDINAEGGADKWTPIHLASVQANYEIMDILLENGAEMMNRTKTGKTPKDVVGNCQIAIKLLNKMEKRWVHNNLINTKKISAPGSEEGLRDVTVVANLENMRSIGSIRHIEERPTREVSQSQVEDKQEEPKRSVTSRQTDLRKSVSSFMGKRSLRIETQLSERVEYREGRGEPSGPTGKRELEKLEKQENGDVEDSLMIGDTDEVSEPKENFELTRVIPKSPNNIQKLQIVQNYRNHLSTLLSPKGSTIGTFDFTKTMTLESGRGTITNKQLQQQQNADMMQKFTFPNEFSKYISKFEHFTDEIKVFQNAILNGNDADMPTSEKLKCLFFMRAIHMKLNKQISKLNSELIPFELFIIFESIDDELKKQALTLPKNKISSSNHHDSILRSLHFIFENLETKDMAQSILIKAKISQMFGEFKYGTARHFLQQLLQNYSESRFLRAEARCALKMLQGQQPTLNLRESLNEKKTSFLLALTSPKGDYLSNPLTRSIKASFLSPSATSTASSSLANNYKNNRKVPVYQEKCAEDIEDEEESILMRKHIQSGLDKEKMRKVLENDNLLNESQLSPPKEDESPEIKKIVPTRNRSMKIETKYTSPKIGAKASFF